MKQNNENQRSDEDAAYRIGGRVGGCASAASREGKV